MLCEILQITQGGVFGELSSVTRIGAIVCNNRDWPFTQGWMSEEFVIVKVMAAKP